MSKRKVIIDTDCGIDDVSSSLLAMFSNQLEIMGLSIVAGNISLENGIENAKTIIALSKLEIPIYPGCRSPLLPGSKSEDFRWSGHSADGFGGFSLKDEFLTFSENYLSARPQVVVKEDYSSQWMIESSKLYPNELILSLLDI